MKEKRLILLAWRRSCVTSIETEMSDSGGRDGMRKTLVRGCGATPPNEPTDNRRDEFYNETSRLDGKGYED